MARSATSARHRLTFHPPRRRLHDALQQRESLVAVSIGTFRYFAGKPSGMPQALAVRRVERRQHSVEHAIPLRRGALQVRGEEGYELRLPYGPIPWRAVAHT
jgi:hypothetical protein